MEAVRSIGLIEARQAISVVLMLLSVCLVVVFARYLLIEARMFGWRNVRKFRVNQAAIAMFVYFAFMTLARAWSAVLYEVIQRGGDLFAVEDTYPVALVSSMGAVMGGLCIIRVFTESNWTWIVALAFITVTTIIIQFVI